MEREGGDSRKVEMFFVSILLDSNCLSSIWCHRRERRKRVCVWVGGMIEREIYREIDIVKRVKETEVEIDRETY